jgi:acetyltransferase-like isoleucine patch superfamily enzyme
MSTFFRALLRQRLAAAKGPAAYDLAPEMTELVCFQILRYASSKVLRGSVIRLRFRQSGGTVMVGRGVTITHPQMISCGRGFVVEDGAELHGLSRNGLRFGHNVTVGRGAQIRPSGYYGRSLGAGLVVGDNSSVGSLCYLGASGGIEIGRDVLMGPCVTVLSEDHVYLDDRVTIKSQGVVEEPTVIEDDVWLGAGSIVLGGAHICKGAVVAAGAVVRGMVPPYSVVAGVPAKVVKQRESFHDRPPLSRALTTQRGPARARAAG